jgi:hypothetical protein
MIHYEHQHWNQDQAPPRQRTHDQSGSWDIPLAVAAFALVAGLLFYNPGSSRVTTASNNGPTAAQPGPTSGQGPGPIITAPPTRR